MNMSYQSLCTAFQGDRKENLTAKLMDRHHWTQKKAHQAIDEYMMFLYIASLNGGVHLVPTQDIDCVWEADILQSTAQYMATCVALCGRVIHHTGTAEMQKTHATTSTQAAFAKTQALFGQYFSSSRLSENLMPAAACGVL